MRSIALAVAILCNFTVPAWAKCGDDPRFPCPHHHAHRTGDGGPTNGTGGSGGWGWHAGAGHWSGSSGEAPAAAPADVAAHLVPVREFMRAADIPPKEAGAYGLVIFQSKATPANRMKLQMVCQSFEAHFPKNKEVPKEVPISDRMITVWPVDDPESELAASDNCDFVIDHYDLYAAESATADAQRQQAKFEGEGPYLVGWSPSNTRGVPDKLVLVIDMSADVTQEQIDRQFLFWKEKIVEDPSLWRSGFSLEKVRIAIRDFADKYGNDMLDAVKLVGSK